MGIALMSVEATPNETFSRFRPYWIVRVLWIFGLLLYAWRAGAGQVPEPLLAGGALALTVQALLWASGRIKRLPHWHDIVSAALAALLASLTLWYFPVHQISLLLLVTVPFVDLARWRGSDALFLLGFFPFPAFLSFYLTGTIGEIYLSPLVSWLLLLVLAVGMVSPDSRKQLIRPFLAMRIAWLVGLLAVAWDVQGISTPLLIAGGGALLLQGLLLLLALFGRLPAWHATISTIVATGLAALILWGFPQRQAVLLLLGLVPVLDLARWRGAGALFLLALFPLPVVLPLYFLGEIATFDLLALAAWLATALSSIYLAHSSAPRPVIVPEGAESTVVVPKLYESTRAQILDAAGFEEEVLASLLRGGCEILNEGSFRSQARAMALTFRPDNLDQLGVAAAYNLDWSVAEQRYQIQGVLGTLIYEGEPLDISSEQPPFDTIPMLAGYRLVLIPLRTESELFGAALFASRDNKRVDNLGVQGALIELTAHASRALQQGEGLAEAPAPAVEVVEVGPQAIQSDEAAPGAPAARPRLPGAWRAWPPKAGRAVYAAVRRMLPGVGKLGQRVNGWRAALAGQVGAGVRTSSERGRDMLREGAAQVRPDIGPYPMLFGALALLSGVMVGLLPVASSNPSVIGIVFLLSIPLLVVVALAIYRLWPKGRVVALRGGGGSASRALPQSEGFSAPAPHVAGRRVALSVSAPPGKPAPISLLEWGLLILVFTTYTRFSDVLVHSHGFPSIAQPLVVLLLAGILGRIFLLGKPALNWVRPAVLLAAYGIVRAASLLYADDFAPAQEAMIDYTKDAIVALIVVLLLANGTMLRRVLWSLLWAGLFLGTISTLQYLTGSFDRTYFGFGQAAIMNIIGSMDDFRIGGPLGEPNTYAQFMLPLIPLAMDRFVHEKKLLLRLLALWALLVVVLAVVFTFSRGALLSMVVMVGIMVLRHPPKPRDIMIAILMLAVLFPFVPPQYLDRMATLLDFLPGAEAATEQEVSFRGRTSELTVGWLMFRDHPLLGVGLHNYPSNYQRYSRELGLDPRREARAPHSLYLEIMSELGLLGIATFGALLWNMFVGMYRARTALQANGKEEYAEMLASLSIGLVGYLTAAVFLHAAYPRFFWLLVGVALAAPQIAQSEQWRRAVVAPGPRAAVRAPLGAARRSL